MYTLLNTHDMDWKWWWSCVLQTAIWQHADSKTLCKRQKTLFPQTKAQRFKILIHNFLFFVLHYKQSTIVLINILYCCNTRTYINMCDPVQITESMSNFQIHSIASSPLDHRDWHRVSSHKLTLFSNCNKTCWVNLGYHYSCFSATKHAMRQSVTASQDVRTVWDLKSILVYADVRDKYIPGN